MTSSSRYFLRILDYFNHDFLTCAASIFLNTDYVLWRKNLDHKNHIITISSPLSTDQACTWQDWRSHTTNDVRLGKVVDGAIGEQ
jgi:hypothetical protein